MITAAVSRWARSKKGRRDESGRRWERTRDGAAAGDRAGVSGGDSRADPRRWRRSKEPSAVPAAGTAPATATGPMTGADGDHDTAAFRPTLRPPMAFCTYSMTATTRGKSCGFALTRLSSAGSKGTSPFRTTAESQAGTRRSAGGTRTASIAGISRTCKAPTERSCGPRPSF